MPSRRTKILVFSLVFELLAQYVITEGRLLHEFARRMRCTQPSLGIDSRNCCTYRKGSQRRGFTSAQDAPTLCGARGISSLHYIFCRRRDSVVRRPLMSSSEAMKRGLKVRRKVSVTVPSSAYDDTMLQVPMKDLERAWMFTASFQTSVVAAKQMENVIGALTANRDFLKELQHEVDGKVWMLRF